MSQDNPTDRIEALIALTERLTACMAADAQAFEERRPQEVAARAAQTGALANQYRHESAKVREAPALIEGAPLALRARLIRATEAFDAVLARHGRAVDAARIVTEGLVRAIAEEVGRQRGEVAGYGPGAMVAPPASAAVAITLNRRA